MHAAAFNPENINGTATTAAPEAMAPEETAVTSGWRSCTKASREARSSTSSPSVSSYTRRCSRRGRMRGGGWGGAGRGGGGGGGGGGGAKEDVWGSCAWEDAAQGSHAQCRRTTTLQELSIARHRTNLHPIHPITPGSNPRPARTWSADRPVMARR